MTSVTVEVLPSIDAAIVVLMADSPFSASEAALVQRLVAQGVRHLRFVVTAIDRIRRAADVARVVESVRERLRATGAVGTDPVVEAVSGRLALEARVEGDAELLAQSGFVALEEALLGDLSRSDGVALVRRLHQIRELCVRLTEGEPKAAPESSSRTALVALLDAATRALERRVQAWREAGARVSAAALPKLEALPKLAAQVAGVAVARHRAKIAPGWLDKRDAIVTELVDDLHASVSARIEEELSGLGALAEQLAGAERAELERASVALEVVLAHVASAMGRPAPAVAGLDRLSVAEPNGEERAPLIPERTVLAEAVDRPDLAALGRGSEKLDFLSKTMAGYNLPTQFTKLVTANLGQRLGQHWEEHPPRDWLEGWWRARAGAVDQGLAQAASALRELQRDALAWSEREAVLREAEARERAFEAGRLGEIRERAGQVIAELSAAGF
jgi:hypothetical protein